MITDAASAGTAAMAAAASPWYIGPLHIGFRLLLAVVLGGIIGFEREMSSHSAGFRTHILVCVGSALIMLLSVYGFAAFADEPQVRMDPARLAAQVISGIGFLGAGTIIRNGLSVSGLTTAASLWVVAAIGLATGAGFYFAALSACLLAFLSLWILSKVEKRFFAAKRIHFIRLSLNDEPGTIARISAVMGSRGIVIRKISMDGEPEAGPGAPIEVNYTVTISKPAQISLFLEELRQIRGVSSVSYE